MIGARYHPGAGEVEGVSPKLNVQSVRNSTCLPTQKDYACTDDRDEDEEMPHLHRNRVLR